MILTKKCKSEKSQWIDLYLNFKGDSTFFLFVIYCLRLNYIHTGVLEAKQNIIIITSMAIYSKTSAL